MIRESEQAAENKRQLAAREKILTVLKSAQKTLYYSSIKKYFELFIVDHLKSKTIPASGDQRTRLSLRDKRRIIVSFMF